MAVSGGLVGAHIGTEDEGEKKIGHWAVEKSRPVSKRIGHRASARSHSPQCREERRLSPCGRRGTDTETETSARSPD